VRLVREIAPAIPDLSTDPGKLSQIILNLLENAVKFTEHGEIKIIASQQNGSLQLIVSDTGIGIGKEDLNKIFEEFYQGDLSTTKKYRGTGLGLAIVKRFVSLLVGRLTSQVKRVKEAKLHSHPALEMKRGHASKIEEDPAWAERFWSWMTSRVN